MRRMKLVLSAVVAFTSLTLLFQNCSNKNFSVGLSEEASTDGAFGSNGEIPGNFALVDMTVAVEMNTPKDFDAAWSGEKENMRLTLVDNGILETMRTQHGQVRIRNGQNFQVTYTPDALFRGEDQVQLYAVASSGRGGIKPSVIRFQVGNSLGMFKPALAIRGSSCTTCHAQVESNFVTDFGYGNYYLETGRGAVSDPSYGFYTDHGYTGGATGGLRTMMLASTSDTIVPRADLVGYLRNLSGEVTLAGYVRNRLMSSAHATSRAAANRVREVRNVFIGAPSKARILQAFQSTDNAGSMKYVADRSNAALAGVPAYSQGRFSISGIVRCDGDLLLQGTVHMDAVQLQTHTGCRIYATGSIFVSNGLSVSPLLGGTDHNLQLVSAKAVVMGLGSTMNAAGSHPCETSGWYRDRWNGGTQDNFARSSIETHLNLHQETSYTRAYGAGAAATTFLNSVIAEAANLNMKDATCESGGRNRTMSRLLVVAPRVDSRYNGNFTGSVVAEAAVMSIGSFKFKFDPVFERVSVLPLLNEADYLKITD